MRRGSGRSTRCRADARARRLLASACGRAEDDASGLKEPRSSRKALGNGRREEWSVEHPLLQSPGVPRAADENAVQEGLFLRRGEARFEPRCKPAKAER